MLEESGASGADPVGTMIPEGSRAGWAESVRQPPSLGGAATGGKVTSVAHIGKNKCNTHYTSGNYNGDLIVLCIIADRADLYKYNKCHKINEEVSNTDKSSSKIGLLEF